MARTGLMATTSSFAHLLGLGAPRAGKSTAEETSDEKKKREDEASAKAEDDEEMRNKAKADKPDDQGEDESDEDYKERKRKEEEDADDDEKDDKDAKSKAIRLRERARCSAIFASPNAGVRPDMAAHLAFSTNMSRAEAINSLAVAARGYAPTPVAAPSGRHSLSERMDRTPNPDIRPDGETGAMKPHQRLLAAHAKATGQKA